MCVCVGGGGEIGVRGMGVGRPLGKSVFPNGYFWNPIPEYG